MNTPYSISLYALMMAALLSISSLAVGSISTPRKSMKLTGKHLVKAIDHLTQNLDIEIDTAHDKSHSLRVMANALRIQKSEGGSERVLISAALIHDLGNLPKTHPDKHLSSQRSAKIAREILSQLDFSEEEILLVEDAVIAHSFSAKIAPTTLEGRIFQDADRLDALGAIGIARVFAVAGSVSNPLYNVNDPFATEGRPLEDRKYALDHFYQKLLKLPKDFLTETGQTIANERSDFILGYLHQLKADLNIHSS